MSKKNKNTIGGIIFSTNPDFVFESDDDETVETLPPHKQHLKIMLDKKQRKGKTVTLISGFIGNADDLKELEKKLKVLCGSGGSSKDDEILIQGDFKDKIFDFLVKNGYGVKRN